MEKFSTAVFSDVVPSGSYSTSTQRGCCDCGYWGYCYGAFFGSKDVPSCHDWQEPRCVHILKLKPSALGPDASDIFRKSLKVMSFFLHHLLWRTVMFRNRKFHHGHTVTMTAWCHGSSGHVSYFAPNNGCLHQKNSQSVVSWVGKYKSGWSSLYFLLLLQIPHCFWLSHVKRSGHVSVVLALRLARAGRAGWKALTMVNNGLRLFIGNHAYEWLLMA